MKDKLKGYDFGLLIEVGVWLAYFGLIGWWAYWMIAGG